MNITKSQNGNQLVLAIQGKIDEDADFSTTDLSSSPRIVLNLEGVQTINSCGIREWIKWIRSAPDSSGITYLKCPKVIVDQINMVEGFLPPGAKVESFFVPYFSEESGSEKSVLMESGQHFGSGGSVRPPQDVKDEEGNAMEIDVIEAKYFKFLEKLK